MPAHVCAGIVVQVTQVPGAPACPRISNRVISKVVITEFDMTRDLDEEIDALLPLAPAFFHILIALGDKDRHGYSIMQDVAERTGGQVRMSPGTLYGSIKRMLAEGLIEE